MPSTRMQFAFTLSAAASDPHDVDPRFVDVNRVRMTGCALSARLA